MRLCSGLGLPLAVFLSASLAACSAPKSAQTSQASSDATDVKIGIDLPVSGADASTGIPTRNGAVLAIEEANRAGGGINFVAFDLDDAVGGTHDPGQGAQNVKQFVSDASVLAMVGPFNSNVATAEIPITNDAGLAQISPANTNTGLTKGDAAKKLRPSHPDTNAYFRVSTTDDRQGPAGAHFARKFGFARAFVIDDNETYGTGLSDAFATAFASAGGTVLAHEHLAKGQTDFESLLTKAAALHPDVVYFGGTTSTGGGLLRKQMGDSALRSVAYMGGDGIGDAEFVKSAGEMANGAYFTVAAPDAAHLPAASAFVDAYRKRFGVAVGPYSANAYTAAKIEIAAIRKAYAKDGSHVPTRAETLALVAATRGFASPIGLVGFDSNGDTTAGILSLYRVKDGTPTFVDQLVFKS